MSYGGSSADRKSRLLSLNFELRGVARAVTSELLEPSTTQPIRIVDEFLVAVMGVCRYVEDACKRLDKADKGVVRALKSDSEED